MKYIGKAIVFVALVIGATTLELHDKEAGGLWLLAVLWVIFGEWQDSKSE